MRRTLLGVGLFGCLMLTAAPASAQLGGGSGLLGGLLPNVGGSTAGNAAGVLSYCVRNKLLGGDGVKSALSSLMGRDDITSSEDFTAGQSGQLMTGQGNGLSLDSVKGKLKSKVCGMVLQNARSFL